MLEANWSRATTRYRLNRHGDRQLNVALDIVARVDLAADPAAKAYKERRLGEATTSREIRRLLTRYIARQIYRHLNGTMTAPTVVGALDPGDEREA